MRQAFWCDGHCVNCLAVSCRWRTRAARIENWTGGELPIATITIFKRGQIGRDDGTYANQPDH
jgi:hypothetical protein